MNLLPRSEALNRLSRIQAWMEDDGVDALFIFQNADLYYFSGTVQVGLLCLPASGEPLFLVQKSLSRARMESPWEHQVGLSSLKKAPELMASAGIRDLKRIGLEMDVLPVNFFMRIKSLLPDAEFVDASEAIRKTRMIKTPYEIAHMREAARLLEQGFKEIPNWMHPGVTELEISARLEGLLRMVGHQGLIRMRGFNYEISYGTISIGPSACYPTYFPGPVGFQGLYAAIPGGAGKRELAHGDILMADIVGGYEGYIVDQTRIYSLGEPPLEMEEAHNFVIEMMRGIESMLRPGRVCEQIWQSAVEMVSGTPYAEGFMGVGDSRVQFLGHGVGLELNELPVLAKGHGTVLEPGMTIAIEPKVFFAGRGGVGLESTYLITPSGFENLTPFPEGMVRV